MSKTILTVDDAATMRKMVSFTLRGAGHEAAWKPKTDPSPSTSFNHARCNLVITDVHMPNMDGIELTRHLRALPTFGRTPILLLTTESDPGKKAEGRAAGATGWIVKPFSQEQLLAIIAKVLPN